MVTQNIIKFVPSGGFTNSDLQLALGGLPSHAIEIIGDSPLNLFDHVTLPRAIAGEYQYLCGYIFSKNTEIGTALRFWLDRDTLNNQNEFAWGFENPANAHPYKYEPHKFFNGADDQITISHDVKYNLLQFSISVWFRTTYSDWIDEGFFISKGGTGSDTVGQNLNWGMWMDLNGKIVAGFEDNAGAGADHYCTSPLAYDDGKWHNAVVTYDQVNVKLYMDGNTTPIATSATVTTPETNTKLVRIGANPRVTPAADYYHGDLDEIRVWNNDLTSAEVGTLYTAGTVPQTAALILEEKFGDDNGSLTAQTIPNITTAPTGVSFSLAGNSPTDANIRDIKLGWDWYQPIWFRRRILANSKDSVDNKGNFMLTLQLKRIGNFPTTDEDDPAGLDTFGISKLSETASGGREWFSNWHTATAHNWTSTGNANSNRDPQDNLVDLHCPSGNVATVDDVNNMMICGGGSTDAWRLYVNDPNGVWAWQPDLEITCYYRAIQFIDIGQSIHIPMRLEGATEHQLEFNCPSSGHGYGFELSHSSKKVRLVKELAHDFYGVEMISLVKELSVDKWIGMKFRQRRVGANAMLLQGYRDLNDGANGGDWIKVVEFLDTGNWPMDPQDKAGFAKVNDGTGKCKLVSGEQAVLNFAASSCYLRADGYEVNYKKYSIREIDPLPEGGTGGEDDGGGGGGGTTPPEPIGNFNMFQTGDSDCNSTTDDLLDEMLKLDPDPEALLICGDVQYTSDPKCWFDRTKAFDSIVHVVIGNHDKFSWYGGHYNMPHSYYSFRVGNVHVLGMDSESSFSAGSAQHTFVVDDLKKASQDSNVDWIFVMIHRPFYSADSEHPDNEGGKTTLYMPIFDQYGVDVIFQGHNHNLQRSAQIKFGSGSDPIIIDSNTSTVTKGRGRIVITNGSGGHDKGGSLYSIDSHADYNIFENDGDNAITMISFSEGNNAICTIKFVTADGEVLDTFTIEP